MDSFIGEIAALASALAFSVTSVCYTFAGRKVNALTASAISLPISWLLILVIHRLSLGEVFPTSAAPERWLYLGVSGILAFVLSLFFMLNAYQHIGPRLTMVIFAFSPVLGAVLAWLFLGQALPPNATVGIAVVIFGIVWVVVERGKVATEGRDVRRGVVYAAVGMLAQAAAFVFASLGVAGGFPPFSATLIRITAGVVTLWVLIALQGKIGATAATFHTNRKLVIQLTGAAVSGPVIAGSLLLLSLQHISVGVATTLSHTTAIMLIPVGYFVFHERITLRAILATVVTVIGIAILFML